VGPEPPYQHWDRLYGGCGHQAPHATFSRIVAGVGKEGEIWLAYSHTLTLAFLALKLPHLLSSPVSLPLPSKLQPPSVVMAFDLSSSRLHTKSDLRKLRLVIGWQSPGYDGKMRHGVVPLTGMCLGEFVYFALYAMSELVLRFSSFFTLLEHYGLQLQHLSLHSMTLVAISCTSVRCTCAFSHWCACSGASTCCSLLGGIQPPSVATTSSTGPRVHLCTLPPLAPASGIAGGRIG
jgi:hypothetical protein